MTYLDDWLANRKSQMAAVPEPLWFLVALAFSLVFTYLVLA